MTNQAKNRQVNLRNLRGCLFIMVLFFGGIYGIYFVCAKILFAHSLPVYVNGTELKVLWPWAREVEGLQYATNGKEERLWVISLYDSKGSMWDRYFIDLINPTQKRLEESIELGYVPIGISTSEMAKWEKTTDNQFFIANLKLPFQFRDGFTGIIIKTEADLIRSFPQLKAGIGEIKKISDYDGNWHEITTKDGLKFLYRPAANILVTKEEIEKELKEFGEWDAPIDVKNPKIKNHFVWGLGNDEVRKELYLVSEYKHIYNSRISPNQLKDLYERRGEMDKELENGRKYYEDRLKREEEYYKNRIELKERRLKALEDDFKKTETEIIKRHQTRTQRQQQLLFHLKNKVFLNGSIIYGDSTLCVVLHTTEISKSAQNKLTCVDKSGKIRWEITPVPSNVLLIEPNMVNTYLKTYRQSKNLVILNTHQYGQIGACKISLADGKVVWDLDLM